MALVKSVGTVITTRTLTIRSKSAADLFVQHLYPHAKWVDNGGSIAKTDLTFTNTETPVRVVFFETTKGLDKVVEMKDQVIQFYGIGKHSVHISDTSEQTLEIGKMVLNANSIQRLQSSGSSTPSQRRKKGSCRSPIDDDE